MESPGEVLLGRLAVQRGLISQDELALAMKTHADRGGTPPLGELLVDLGLLSRMQLDDLLARQKENLQAPSPYSGDKTVGEDLLGRRAVEAGLLSQPQLSECLRLQGLSQQIRKPKRLGEIVVEKGYLTVDQVKQLLSGQGKRIVRCPACSAQYNVHGAPRAVALKCRQCGARLVEAAPSRPAEPPDPAQLSAEGSWYEEESPAPKSAAPKKAARPARNRKTVKVEEGAEYLPYERRLEISATRKRWTVAGGVGLMVLIAVFLIKVAGGDESRSPNPKEPASQAGTDASTPQGGPVTVAKTLDEDLSELQEILTSADGKDVVACLERLKQLRGKARDSRDEERIAELSRAVTEEARALGKAEFEKRVDAARRAEMDQKYGEALGALEDLPPAQDPLGCWNAELAKERKRIPQSAREEWTLIASKAERLVREGRREEGLREAARGETFGIAEIERAAKELAERLSALVVAPPPAEDPPPAKPPAAGGNPPAAGGADPQPGPVPAAVATFDALLDLLAGHRAPWLTADSTPCPLCRDLPSRKRPCATCKGSKQAPCPWCAGSGVRRCPGGLHEKYYGQEGDAGHVKKRLNDCKVCGGHPEKPCPGCKGKKGFACKDCGGQGGSDWACPLSKASKTVPLSGSPCWMCGGEPLPCVVCGGEGGTAVKACAACYGIQKVPCPKCKGSVREPCGKCGGSGKVRTETKAGIGYNEGTGELTGDSGGNADVSSCGMCGGEGFDPCKDCGRTGLVACSCAGKEAPRVECWACKGQKTLPRCPACATGTISWAPLPGGASVFLCSLSDLEPMVDLGMRAVVGSKHEWLVLIVDNRAGKEAVPWTAEHQKLILRAGDVLRLPSPEEVGPAAFKQALDADGRLFGLRPELLAGEKVEAGQASVFLIGCRAAPKLDQEVILYASDGTGITRMAHAAMTSGVRELLLSKFWTEEAMTR